MHTVREFLEEALRCAGIKFESRGAEDNEKYYTQDGVLIFEVDPKFYRLAEVHELCGDPTLAENEMGWVRKTDFSGLVKKMYQSDYMLLTRPK
jgi:GDPmannose 4,6-dehydratase